MQGWVVMYPIGQNGASEACTAACTVEHLSEIPHSDVRYASQSNVSLPREILLGFCVSRCLEPELARAIRTMLSQDSGYQSGNKARDAKP